MTRRVMSDGQMELVADRFRALGEPARLRILGALRDHERNVTQLVRATGLTQANLSKHLQLLLRLGFVERRKEGLSTYYSLADRDVFRLCDIMCGRLDKELHERRKALA